MPMMFPIQTKMFQSTYLYKVRPSASSFNPMAYLFQSTYLYKVRPILNNRRFDLECVSIHVPI